MPQPHRGEPHSERLKHQGLCPKAPMFHLFVCVSAENCTYANIEPCLKAFRQDLDADCKLCR